MKMPDQDFRRLSEFIQAEYGIRIPLGKKFLLETRLQKRLSALGLQSYSQYCDYVLRPGHEETEVFQMMDLVSTNKTEFFRESQHFDYLAGKALPDLLTREWSRQRKVVSLWSAGCSTGEEPYTLAMVLSEIRESRNGGSFDYAILATDISTRALAVAQRGIYPEDRAESIPPAFRKRYLLRSRDRENRLIRVEPELRDKIDFRRLNLMEEDFRFIDSFDIIFCRNVIIYFGRETQIELIHKFHGSLRDGGYLFLGHAESLGGFDSPFQSVAPTVYRKTPKNAGA